MRTRNYLIVGAIISLMFLVLSCYKNKDDYNSSPSANTIAISSAGFSPASLTVATGSTVTWTNNDNMVHAVTTADGSINSGDIAAGSSYSKTFTTAGTFNYFDAQNNNMKGVLIVTTMSGGGY